MCKGRRSTNLRDEKGGVMQQIWITVSFAFVFGTLALVAFAVLRMFGGGHWHHRH
jgi:hypothetical protein